MWHVLRGNTLQIFTLNAKPNTGENFPAVAAIGFLIWVFRHGNESVYPFAAKYGA
jgi:hypothetical protein